MFAYISPIELNELELKNRDVLGIIYLFSTVKLI
jgi:hypothetical protein